MIQTSRKFVALELAIKSSMQLLGIDGKDIITADLSGADIDGEVLGKLLS
jgi:hypothetical protein